jgi:hypothetical protein
VSKILRETPTLLQDFSLILRLQQPDAELICVNTEDEEVDLVVVNSQYGTHVHAVSPAAQANVPDVVDSDHLRALLFTSDDYWKELLCLHPGWARYVTQVLQWVSCNVSRWVILYNHHNLRKLTQPSHMTMTTVSDVGTVSGGW